MNPQKNNSEKIYQHIKYLSSQPWLADSQKFWPRYIFHFTDIVNAKSILENGCLYSRNEAQELGINRIDIAGHDIIEKTPEKWKDFVRLYFRPRTPTQYSNEGFRPKDQLTYNAHCPIPVFFVFDAGEILTRKSTCFSNGNLRVSGVAVDNNVDFYLSLPFKDIYHDTGFSRLSESERNRIKFHRHAEVLVPHSLDLSALKTIAFRSDAESETFKEMLPYEIQKKWRNKFWTDKGKRLFYAKWLYIQKASLTDSSVVFSFNPAYFPGPFEAEVIVEDLETGKKSHWTENDFRAKSTLKLNLSKISSPAHYRITFSLDKHIAYQNTYFDDSGLF